LHVTDMGERAMEILTLARIRMPLRIRNNLPLALLMSLPASAALQREQGRGTAASPPIRHETVLVPLASPVGGRLRVFVF